MQKLVLLASYLFLLPLILTSLIFYSLYFVFSKDLGKVKSDTTSYRAVAENSLSSQHILQVKEARIAKLKNYLQKYNSPLQYLSEYIVKKSDEYGLDYRLTTAIAMTESTLCRNEPINTHNCWGYGITGAKIKWFKSYEDAINEVSRSLSESYAGRGLTTPHEIVTRYNPGSTTWADKVEKFMSDIDLSL